VAEVASTGRGCQDGSVYRQGITAWIIATVVVCAALGALAGHQLGDGRAGNIALISATCAVLGSFLPGSVLLVRTRLRNRAKPGDGGRPRAGAA
jgi:uncharacterized protein YcfJ